MHSSHDHTHSPDCQHKAVAHDDHHDYLHDGHLHHVGASGLEEHTLGVDDTNPAACTPEHNCDAHDSGHTHGTDCGHAAVPHGDHVGYLVDGHLHHPHEGHCDYHGRIAA
ncbi:hypothetical protein [Euzebya tangerina]|uniref:hypothetical protein n=1 Tax=Euzebya tangerina TaxID=591198 RepID=UPI00196B2D7E|nr:hypothetical protein [Euzebya tangerina]